MNPDLFKYITIGTGLNAATAFCFFVAYDLIRVGQLVHGEIVLVVGIIAYIFTILYKGKNHPEQKKLKGKKDDGLLPHETE